MKSSIDRCRLCLQSFPRGRRVAVDDELFQEKLKTVFSFAIVPIETLPIEACRGCSVTVENFFAFCEKVRANQETLQAMDFPEGIKLEPLEEKPDLEILLRHPTDPSTAVLENTFHSEVLKVEPLLSDTTLGGIQNEEATNRNSSNYPSREPSLDVTNDDPFQDDQGASSSEPTSDCEKSDRKIVKPSTKKSKVSRIEEDKKLREYFHLGCEMCPYLSETVPDLYHHYRQQHQTKGYVRCCNRKFFRRARLLEHLGGHVGSIVCELCGKVYKSNFYLELHKIDRHGAPGTRPYKCDKCNMSFHKPYILRTHQMRHMKTTCTVCNKVLMGVQGLKSHMQKMHGKDTKLICPTCGKEFRCQVAMDRHMNAHKGIVMVEKLQCDKCDRWFDGKYNLRRHIRYIHEEEGQLECNFCQHVSPNRRALAHHKQRLHKEKKMFKCELCGKERNTKLGLREHMATHTKIPLYSCEFCSLTFNSNANKYSHRKNKHREEWEAMKQSKMLDKKGENRDSLELAPLSTVKN